MSKKNVRPSRIAQEQRTVEQMIRLYCRKKEGNKELCPQCLELLEYARVTKKAPTLHWGHIILRIIS